MSAPLLEVAHLSKTFAVRRGWLARAKEPVAAVADVSFAVAAGETLGIVGESGSGKSTTARLLMRLIEPSAGHVRFAGEDLLALDAETLRRRRRGLQMVFQDPFSSLNPRLTVGDQVGEPMRIHGLAPAAAIGERVAQLFTRVGLDPARLASYPHEFSGGQRQRIAIARALAAEPRLIIADEAVSALDVSVRAQILNLLDDLKRSSGIGIVFISHDLAVVRHLVDRIIVMYRGRIVESGATGRLFATPRHPYTRALLAAMPVPHVGARRARPLPAAPPAAAPDASGCPYLAHCPLAVARCAGAMPVLTEQVSGQASACFRADDVEPFGLAEASLPAAAAARLKRLQARFLGAGQGATP